MITAAFVNIWNKRVGAIAWDVASQTASFEYAPEFWRNGWDLSPIKMPITEPQVFRFPALRQSTTFKGLPGLLADVLPDRYGNTLMNTWLLKNGRAAGSMNPVEQLCFIGKRGMGAMEFEPVVPQSSNRSTRVEIGSLVGMATQILAGRANFSTNLSADDEKALIDVLKIGTSAGGARAKAVIAYNEITGEIRSGQAEAPDGFEHWLLKFDGVHDAQFGVSSGYGQVEMAYYLMAKQAGIDMMESRLVEENGRTHFMTKRFDRPTGNTKLHVQSFCGLNHFDFDEVGLYSYEELFQTMRFLRLSYAEAEQLFIRMVFNVMARNCDDHAKNFAFTMSQDGKWHLAPAFDVCHAYRPNSVWVSQHSLSINGKRQHIGRDDLMVVASQMNIRKAEELIEKVKNTVNHWQDFANSVKVNDKLAKAIQNTLWII